MDLKDLTDNNSRLCVDLESRVPKKLVILGGIDDLISNLCLTISYTYASLKNTDEGAAKEFKRVWLKSLANKEFLEQVILNDVFAKINADMFFKGASTHKQVVSVNDKDELKRQLDELKAEQDEQIEQAEAQTDEGE